MLFPCPSFISLRTLDPPSFLSFNIPGVSRLHMANTEIDNSSLSLVGIETFRA